ncbi:MAG: hypothetical protein SPJ89_13075 [Treponema sp.]|nr:hypothetical protein [Spirochaetia bacterium]MDD7458652.1 hypothetical protein [Spirochaetales bacterium]MDY5812895.1 hypothetical protein [Treponema sp.]
MAISRKVRPSAADITASLNMMNGTDTMPQAQVQAAENVPNPQQIESGASPVQTQPVQPEKAKISTTKDTQIIFRTTEANKNSLKSFFAGYGFSLSKGIQLACFYLEQEIKAGNITIGPAGILKKER